MDLYRGDILVGRNEHTSLGPVAPGVPLVSSLLYEDQLCVPGTYHAEVAGSTSTGFSDFISTASAAIIC